MKTTRYFQEFKGIEVTDSYTLDNHFRAGGGWLRFNTYQDSFVYGCWVNAGDMIIVEYAEGDIIETKCDNLEEFLSQIIWIDMILERNRLTNKAFSFSSYADHVDFIFFMSQERLTISVSQEVAEKATDLTCDKLRSFGTAKTEKLLSILESVSLDLKTDYGVKSGDAHSFTRYTNQEVIRVYRSI